MKNLKLKKLALGATVIALSIPLLGVAPIPQESYNEENDVYAISVEIEEPIAMARSIPEPEFASIMEEEIINPIVVEEEPALVSKTKSTVIRSYTTTTDITQPCGLTAEELNKGLLHNLNGYGGTFLKAEQEYGINAIALASIAALEGDWGRSSASRNKNNFFGWGPGIHFTTKEKGIMTVAESLSENYLDPNGKHYNGPHLKGVNKKYCTDGPEYWEWKNKVCATMNSIVKRALED